MHSVRHVQLLDSSVHPTVIDLLANSHARRRAQNSSPPAQDSMPEVHTDRNGVGFGGERLRNGAGFGGERLRKQVVMDSQRLQDFKYPCLEATVCEI